MSFRARAICAELWEAEIDLEDVEAEEEP